MKNKFFILFFIWFIVPKTNAQFLDKNYYLIDSLVEKDISNEDKKTLDAALKTYHKSNSDTTKLQLISRLVENVQDENIWIKYNRLLYTASLEKQAGATGQNQKAFKSCEALALNNYGYYYFNYSNNFDIALKYYKLSLDLHERAKNYDGLITAYSNIANVYQNKGDLSAALNWYKKSLSYENKVSKQILMLAPINNMAQVYLYLNDTVNALKNLKRCLSLSAKSDDKSARAHLLHNIGLINVRRGDTSGIQDIKKALADQKKIGDKKGIIQSSLSMAGIYREKKNLVLAKEYLDLARQTLQGINNPNQEGLYYYVAGNIAENETDTIKAIDMYEKSLSIYKQFSLGPELNNVLGYLLRAYSNKKAYALKKLEAFELMQKVSEKVNKNNLQKLMLKQRFEDQLRIQEAEFKAEQKVKEEKNRSEKRKQQYVLFGISIILLLTIIFSFFIYKSFTRIKQKNKIISEQKHLIEEKHKDITDSINYAQRIQSALIISEEKLNKNLKQAFVLFKPRDIVSGDFYWYSEHNGLKIVALADCTGHGVPGAFMSMIGITLLNQIVNEKGITSPALILNNLRKEVIRALNTDDSDKRDGMDIALIAFNDKQLFYAGANSQALLLNNGQVIELKPNKQPIGLYEKQDDFVEQKVEITENLRIYLFSDGIVDQFGGENGKKVKTRQFKEWLLLTSDLTLSQQKTFITDKLDNWKKGYEQTDDISLIGIKLG